MLEKNNTFKNKQATLKEAKETFEEFISNPELDELEIGEMIIRNNEIISNSLNLTNDEIREGEYIFIDSNDREGTFDADTVGGLHASEILSQEDFNDHKDGDHSKSGTINDFEQQETYFENHSHDLTAEDTNSSEDNHVHDGSDHPVPLKAEKADTADVLRGWQDGEILTMDNSGDIPIGSVVWFYGELNDIPSGFLLCNGGEIGTGDSEEFSELYDIVGRKYAADSDSNIRRIPDLINRFIRSASLGVRLDEGGRDINPDEDNRDDKSYQSDDLKRHRHRWRGPESICGSRSSASRSVASGEASRNTSNTGEGDETRPPNIALLPIIKYKNSYHAEGQVL